MNVRPFLYSLASLGAGLSGFAQTPGNSQIVVNAPGLRVEGPKGQVDSFLNPHRVQQLTGTGGTLTVAYSDNSTGLFNTDPDAASLVRLGFDAVGTATPIYLIGTDRDDLNGWAGLVVNGGTVRMTDHESFEGSPDIKTSLDLTGGRLIMHNGTLAKTLTFEGGANLLGGTLDGGIAGDAGTLVISGDLIAGPSLQLENKPNITINVSGPANVSGSDIVGIGVFTKRGHGTLTLRHHLTADLMDLKNGTLLLHSADLIGDSTAMKLSGGNFATGGHNETLGTLTLAANSTIDLGSGASILHFADSSSITWAGDATLTIANWTGGSDQLFFGNAMTALTAEQVGQIRFLNPNGVNGIYAAMILATGEIVPVPEPATIGFGVLLLGALGYRERQRLRQFFAKAPAV